MSKMPVCFSVIPCVSCALDRDTNNWSLFHVIESLGAPLFGQVAPLDIIAFWRFRPEELDHEFQGQLVLANDDGSIARFGPEFPVKSAKSRLRIRIQGLPFPDAPGEFLVACRVREPGAEWGEAEGRWPVTFSLAVPGEPPAVIEPPAV